MISGNADDRIHLVDIESKHVRYSINNKYFFHRRIEKQVERCAEKRQILVEIRRESWNFFYIIEVDGSSHETLIASLIGAAAIIRNEKMRKSRKFKSIIISAAPRK